MARQGPGGSLICPFCERALPRTEYATDGWKERHGKNPGRCLDCEKELGRAKTAFSPTARYKDADHTAAYQAAKEVCRRHAWGTGYYTKSVKAHYREIAKREAKPKTSARTARTAVQRHADEAALHGRAERRRAEREQELDRAARRRAARPVAEVAVAEVVDPEKEARKAAIRERRARTR